MQAIKENKANPASKIICGCTLIKNGGPSPSWVGRILRVSQPMMDKESGCHSAKGVV